MQYIDHQVRTIEEPTLEFILKEQVHEHQRLSVFHNSNTLEKRKLLPEHLILTPYLKVKEYPPISLSDDRYKNNLFKLEKGVAKVSLVKVLNTEIKLGHSSLLKPEEVQLMPNELLGSVETYLNQNNEFIFDDLFICKTDKTPSARSRNLYFFQFDILVFESTGASQGMYISRKLRTYSKLFKLTTGHRRLSFIVKSVAPITFRRRRDQIKEICKFSLFGNGFGIRKENITISLLSGQSMVREAYITYMDDKYIECDVETPWCGGKRKIEEAFISEKLVMSKKHCKDPSELGYIDWSLEKDLLN